MPTDAVALRRELVALRQDEGRTLLKLLASPAIRTALGDPAERDLLARFDGAIASLGADQRSLALKNAYGIGQRDPGILTERREKYGAQAAVNRGPDTVKNWENEKLDELVARLATGSALPADEHHMVGVAVANGRILTVAEGPAGVGESMRQIVNPNPEPFLPGFIYTLPPYLRPQRLTITVLFMDAIPKQVWAEATADLTLFVAGDERQHLPVTSGGLPDLDAAGWVRVNWDRPQGGVYFGVVWLHPVSPNRVTQDSAEIPSSDGLQ